MYKIIFMAFQLFLIVNSKSLNGTIKNIINTANCLHGFCDYAENYNEDAIIRLLSEYKGYLPPFGKVIDLAPMHFKNSIKDRLGFETTDDVNYMCPIRTETRNPKIGITIDGREKFIVNVKGYIQSVTFQVCTDDAKCYVEEDHLPLNTTCFCANQFMTARLAVINDNNTITMEEFPVPSGCACMYRTNLSSK